MTLTEVYSACNKPGKWAVECLCARSIDFASFYDGDIWFYNCSDSVIFFSLDFTIVPTVWYFFL
jgi:hypothetical protein